MKRNSETILTRIFGNRSPEAVDAIIESAPVRNLLAEVDSAEVQRRAALLQRLHDLPDKHEKVCGAAYKEVERAKQAVVAAQEAVNAAHKAHCDAYGRAVALSSTYDMQRSALEREIERSADARIWRFVSQSLDLFGQARHVAPVFVMTAGGRTGHYDVSIGLAACEALNAAAEAARELIWSALTTEEVTKALERIRAGLVPPLSAAGLQPPKIDDEQILTTSH